MQALKITYLPLAQVTVSRQLTSLEQGQCGSKRWIWRVFPRQDWNSRFRRDSMLISAVLLASAFPYQATCLSWCQHSKNMRCQYFRVNLQCKSRQSIQNTVRYTVHRVYKISQIHSMFYVLQELHTRLGCKSECVDHSGASGPLMGTSQAWCRCSQERPAEMEQDMYNT